MNEFKKDIKKLERKLSKKENLKRIEKRRKKI
jgi:hypothetical protein